MTGIGFNRNSRSGELIFGRRGRSLNSVVASVIIGAIILFAIFTRDEVGLSPGMKIAFAAFAILQIMVTAYLYQRHRNRMEKLGLAASKLGLRMSPSGDIKLVLDYLMWLSLQPAQQASDPKVREKISNHMGSFRKVTVRPFIQGTFKGITVSLGQHTVTSRKGSNRTPSTKAHFFIEHEKRLPRISIYPAMGIGRKTYKSEKFNSIRYKARPDSDALSNEFLSSYVVLSEDENAARALCTNELMDFMLRYSKYFKDRRLENILIRGHTMQLSLDTKLEKDDIEPILELLVFMSNLLGKCDVAS
jgi:hypothetical protein